MRGEGMAALFLAEYIMLVTMFYLVQAAGANVRTWQFFAFVFLLFVFTLMQRRQGKGQK
jgi:hypothetical protein